MYWYKSQTKRKKEKQRQCKSSLSFLSCKSGESRTLASIIKWTNLCTVFFLSLSLSFSLRHLQSTLVLYTKLRIFTQESAGIYFLFGIYIEGEFLFVFCLFMFPLLFTGEEVSLPTAKVDSLRWLIKCPQCKNAARRSRPAVPAMRFVSESIKRT